MRHCPVPQPLHLRIVVTQEDQHEWQVGEQGAYVQESFHHVAYISAESDNREQSVLAWPYC